MDYQEERKKFIDDLIGSCDVFTISQNFISCLKEYHPKRNCLEILKVNNNDILVF